jgi:hypothetical protein
MSTKSEDTAPLTEDSARNTPVREKQCHCILFLALILKKAVRWL